MLCWDITHMWCATILLGLKMTIWSFKTSTVMVLWFETLQLRALAFPFFRQLLYTWAYSISISLKYCPLCRWEPSWCHNREERTVWIISGARAEGSAASGLNGTKIHPCVRPGASGYQTQCVVCVGFCFFCFFTKNASFLSTISVCLFRVQLK